MKLTDLEPAWIEHEGRRVALIFRCPHCLGFDRNRAWLTCFFEPAATLPNDLLEHVRDNDMVVGCNPQAAWSRSGDSFASLTLAPSIDASAAGHWHGVINLGVVA